jgi:hypothetical protein
MSGKGTFDQLLDILLDVPVILQQLTNMHLLPMESQLQTAVRLLQSCIKLDGELQLFSYKIESLSQKLLYWEVQSSGIECQHTDTVLFPSCFAFTDSQAATTMVLYWGVLAMDWSGMCHLYRHISQLTTLTPTTDEFLAGQCSSGGVDGLVENFLLPVPTRCKDFASVARKVLKSVDYCFQDHHALPGLVAPLNMVIDVLSGWPGFESEVEWARGNMDRMRQKGLKIMDHLR